VIRTSLFPFTVICAALAGGCAQDTTGEEPSSNDVSTADALLSNVHGCMKQSACADDAGANASCSQLAACLAGLVPQGGSIAYDAGIPGNSGGHATGLLGKDGGLPGLGGLPGGGNGIPGIGSGNGFPGIGNGIPGVGNGIPGIGNGLPVIGGGNPLGDAGITNPLSCITDLGTCLSNQTNPATCAQQAIQCLQALGGGGIF
jgi:hypothetical protein